MNQILVTEKLYVTPDLKRKRKLYKVQFFLAILLICLLSSYYIYAEYDRNKSEEVSQALLAEVKTDEDNTIKKPSEDDAIIIVLSEEEADEVEEEMIEEEVVEEETVENDVTVGENTYSTDAIITIPKIDLEYPVLSESNDELLKISVNKYFGPEPNEKGNYCIVGHNYRNGKMFGRLNELENDDIVLLQDMSGRTVEYSVYKIYVVDPSDARCTSQLTNGRKELTLITCTNYGTQRLIVKCKEI